MALQEENESNGHTSPQAASTDLLLPLNVDEALIREDDYITTSHDAHALLDQEFVFPFPDPVSTLDIHGSARSVQGVQEAVREGGVESSNISYGGNTSLPNNPTMGQNPPRHLFNDPYEYELEKLRIEKEILKKSVEEMTSQIMAELDRKMAEARNEFDRETQELDAAYKAKAMEEEAHMSFVQMGSLLANAFVSKCSERSASNDLAAVRALISQHSVQHQQAVQTNTHVNSTAPQQEVQASTHMSSCTCAPPRPSVTAVEDPTPNSSSPLSHLPHGTMTQPIPMPQQTVRAHPHVNSTVPSPPSVTAVEPQTPNHIRPPVRFPRPTTTQPSPLSKQVVVQSSTNINANSLPRPSVTTEALPLHSPLSNTSRPRPRPVISNLTPSSSTAASSPPVHGTVRRRPPHLARGPPPHLMRGRAPHLKPLGSSPAPIAAAAAASTTRPRRLVQEQEQQQGKSKDGLVYLSDEDV